MQTGKFMKKILAALVLTAALPMVASAKTQIVLHHGPSQAEKTAILSNVFRAIEHDEVGPMRFSLSKSPQSGLIEVLYAPPAWYKRAWDQDKIYRIGTAFADVKDITVKGDYIVVTGKQKSGAESQISLLFKTRNYPFKKNIMLRQGPPPTAKSPTVLDLVVDGCTGLGDDNAVDSNGGFVPKFLNLYGQDKNGAFDLGLLGENHISAQADELKIRPNGDVELTFDSGTTRVIGKIDIRELPAEHTCGRVVVELAGPVSLSYKKSTRPMLEGGMFFPFPVIVVKHDVRLEFQGQELRCEMLSSRDEVVGYKVKGARNCSSNPEG
ncbi:hypothetical protein [Bdellovibrio sp. HCB337]|uniref:hypothetical protein n=1 Tax=Bdellovibrio sp. HCB337 TaxID=3394358 RepID=UPI0039A57D76